jgi:hypothetical protein
MDAFIISDSSKFDLNSFSLDFLVECFTHLLETNFPKHHMQQYNNVDITLRKWMKFSEILLNSIRNDIRLHHKQHAIEADRTSIAQIACRWKGDVSVLCSIYKTQTMKGTDREGKERVESNNHNHQHDGLRKELEAVNNYMTNIGDLLSTIYKKIQQEKNVTEQENALNRRKNDSRTIFVFDDSIGEST